MGCRKHQLSSFVLCLVTGHLAVFCHVYQMIIAGVLSCLRRKVDGHDCLSAFEIVDALPITDKICLEGRCHLILTE